MVKIAQTHSNDLRQSQQVSWNQHVAAGDFRRWEGLKNKTCKFNKLSAHLKMRAKSSRPKPTGILESAGCRMGVFSENKGLKNKACKFNRLRAFFEKSARKKFFSQSQEVQLNEQDAIFHGACQSHQVL